MRKKARARFGLLCARACTYLHEIFFGSQYLPNELKSKISWRSLLWLRRCSPFFYCLYFKDFSIFSKMPFSQPIVHALNFTWKINSLCFRGGHYMNENRLLEFWRNSISIKIESRYTEPRKRKISMKNVAWYWRVPYIYIYIYIYI